MNTPKSYTSKQVEERALEVAGRSLDQTIKLLEKGSTDSSTLEQLDTHANLVAAAGSVLSSLQIDGDAEPASFE